MCYAIEKLKADAVKEATEKTAREATISSAIDTARRYGVAEDVILADIMDQFELTEEEASEYMTKESA